jgi:hypothetical protein
MPVLLHDRGDREPCFLEVSYIYIISIPQDANDCFRHRKHVFHDLHL